VIPGATGGSPTTATGDNKTSNTSIIIGTVLGTFAVSILLSVGGFLLYRRNRKEKESGQPDIIQIAGNDNQGERESYVYGSGGTPFPNTSVNYPPASPTSPAPVNTISGQGPLQTPRNEYNYSTNYAPIAPTPVNSYGQERNYNLGQERNYNHGQEGNYNYEQERSYNLPTINNEGVSTVSTADINSIKNELRQEIMQNLRQAMLQNNGGSS